MQRCYALILTGFLIAGCEHEDHKPLVHWLAGSWAAPAFDGELHETWTLEGNALMVKQGYYIEHDDTLYSEQVKIDSLFGGIYLLAQPRGGNPVIFRCTDHTGTTLVFENHGNRNPFRVTYENLGPDAFIRMTYGVERGDTVSNTFSFTRSTP